MFIWYRTDNTKIQPSGSSNSYTKKQVLPSFEWTMIEVHFPLKALSFAFISSGIKRGSRLQHQKTCYDMKIHNLFSDLQTMWKGHLSMTLTTKIVTSSLEGKWNLFLPAIILENRPFRLNWLLMKIAQAIKFTIPFTCCIQIKNIYSRWKRLRTHALKTQGVKKGLKMLVSASFESNLWLTVLNEDTGEIWWLPRMPCLM